MGGCDHADHACIGIDPCKAWAGRGDSSGHCVADSEISVIGPVGH